MSLTFVFNEFGRETLSVHADRCARSSGLAVRLMNDLDGEEYATVSLDLGIQHLADDEFVFKTFNGYHMLLTAMLEAGIVEVTDRSVHVGAIGPQPICRLLKR
jgi:hypothetical protein